MGTAAGVGASAGSVISGGVIAPIAASATSASVASVVADQVVGQPTPTPVSNTHLTLPTIYSE